VGCVGGSWVNPKKNLHWKNRPRAKLEKNDTGTQGTLWEKVVKMENVLKCTSPVCWEDERGLVLCQIPFLSLQV